MTEIYACLILDVKVFDKRKDVKKVVRTFDYSLLYVDNIFRKNSTDSFLN